MQGKAEKFHAITRKVFLIFNFNPKKHYCLYFKETTLDLLPTLIIILQRSFKLSKITPTD